MKLIVGLGNPGVKYKNTHHNIGFMCIDKIAEKNNLKFKKELRFNAEIAQVRTTDDQIIYVKPQTFMNNSGESVGKLTRYYKVNPEDILIIHDDLDLPLGKIRIRKNGSSGGHNGLKSIISCLSSQEFPRIRIGIDNPNDSQEEVIDYVLSTFSKSEMEILNPILDSMPKIIEDYLSKGIDYIMNNYNKRD